MPTQSPALVLPATPAATNGVAQVDIRDIRPPVRVPSGWAWLGWLLAAALLAAALYWAWRRWRRHRETPRPGPPPIPPGERARRRLQDALHLLDQPKPFCILVSDTLRIYLEERFNLRAPERTTEEFLEELQHSALLSLEQKRRLGDFLVRCDLVKFARHEPLRPELQETLDVALRLIEETEPPPAPAPTPDAPAEATPTPARP